MGILDSQYGNLLNPEEQKKSQQGLLLNLALGLLSQSGPSTTPKNFGSILGNAGLGALQNQGQVVQGLLQSKLIKSRLEEQEAEKRRNQGLLGLVGQQSQRYEPGQGQAPILDQPGTGLLGDLEQNKPNALRDYYAKAAAFDPRLGIAGLTSLQPQKQEPFTLSPGQIRFDPLGRQIAQGGRDSSQEQKVEQDKFKRAESLRDNYNMLTKDFRTINDSYARIKASSTNPSAAGDLSMIFNYMKMLDPGSVVRESEFATAAASGSYGERIQGYVQKAINGQRLAPEIRDDFTKRAGMLYKAQQGNYEQIRGQYSDLSKRAQIDPKDVITDFRVPSKEEAIGANDRSSREEEVLKILRGK